ncbi:MAG: bifunctional alpha,alpha-trehalose-phosphate synthase (UDP-forming)/trehalose-phosphatase [Spirochaetales bacterium]|nr:bifunctional alpha,alpha-trehalose-phosphate synthase (UDP-forming)/trehalose-phosphatase [Spirochaetales bacterium]
MGKIILVSNRLSVSVHRRKGRLEFDQSMGGLATGLSSLEGAREKLWIGWSGLASEEQLPDEGRELENELRAHYDSIPVSLCTEELNRFYFGFCNNVIWPLFHYFPTYANYDESLWDSYRQVNRRYMERVCEVAQPDDVLWVHDYQLMLLPRMLRDEIPEARIGFFLHIPFPSYEVFRLLPWRHELLNGLLGADLIGFHTYDYARHFISSVRRLLGVEDTAGYVRYRKRMCKVDVFPMGIDYRKYSTALEQPRIRRERERATATLMGRKVVLSVDRLDYTKGIPQRLRAFDRYLERNPEAWQKVVLLLIVVPSRTRVPRYRTLKREVDELVSSINGRYGTIDWEPVRYFYRPFPYDRLTALYGLADVMLVTPLRDGMNLVAKEFVATRASDEQAGVLILSETAGAAKELGEALLINPNNVEEIAQAIETALSMEPEERRERNALMRERLSRYDIRYWAQDFLEKLDSVVELHEQQQARQLTESVRRILAERYGSARRRLLLLDYDGTLVPLSANPDRARPDPELLELLRRLVAHEGTEVVISSGRGRDRLAGWFEGLQVSLIARHGVWLKRMGQDWQLIEPLNGDWKEILRPVLELHRDRTPGSSIEEGEYSMSWYYRKTEPELAAVRVSELKDALYSLTRDLGLEVLEGNKFLEIKHLNVHKGRAVSRWLEQGDWDFLLAAGDDQTDEAMFSSLPECGVAIKVGQDISNAAYFVDSPETLRSLLEEWSA